MEERPSLPTEVVARFEQYSSQELIRLFRAPPRVLWHYTTGANLINIVEGGSLWATHVSCLNDQTEFKFAVGLVREAFRRRRAAIPAPRDEEVRLFEYVENGLGDDSAKSVPYFIACFSEVPDDLSQWRAYGGGEGGYAIGFAGPQIGLLGIDRSALLVPVSYGLAPNIAFADALAGATHGFYLESLSSRGEVEGRQWLDLFFEAWAHHFGYHAAIMKHEAFHAEEEWRFIRWFREGEDVRSLQFRQRQSMMSRHLPMHFPIEGATNAGLLPIKEIIVGPTRHKDISQVAVGDLLRKVGYPDGSVEVRASAAPFQAV